MDNDTKTRTFTVRYSTQIDVAVDVEARDEEEARELAAAPAEEYLSTIYGDSGNVRATATLDGVGAYEVEEA